MKNRERKNLKTVQNMSGITLIALVVTIVILLILAGVSMNLVLGNNGIITKSQETQIATRAAGAEDEVELWKGNNYIAKNSNQSSESKEDMLQRLKDKKLVYEDEIDRNNEIITIKKGDGTIVKEINYGGVVINISKTPEIEKAGTVMLQVTSVEGIENRTINSDEDVQKLFEDIEALDEETKKTSIKNLYPKILNEKNGTNFSTFTEVLQYLYEQGEIEANTEEAFWARLNPEDYSNIIMDCLAELCYDITTGTVTLYSIINPSNTLSDKYVATKNGTYTFTINNLITGKSYTKSVEVTNIDENLIRYAVANFTYDQIVCKTTYTKLATLENVKIAEIDPSMLCIGLQDKFDNNFTTFEQAYIMYNGVKIDISDSIDPKTCKFLTPYNLKNSYNIKDGEYVFILVKDGIEYSGTAKVELEGIIF